MRKDIGLEIHVQLNTKSKLFSSGENCGGDMMEPNTCISYLDVGVPGTFPQLNEEAVKCAIRAGYALNCKINEYSAFDRKHYFYHDLPLGYQITQFFHTICGEGYVDIGYKKIRIKSIHMECDAGKIVHIGNKTMVNYNRSGVPLIEIVTCPDIGSEQEAKDFVRELILCLEYAKVSQCNLENGNVRFDVNLSVRNDENSPLGTRVEIKNLNSIKFMGEAIIYEYDRHCKLLQEGKRIVQETRMYDPESGTTISMRSKEGAVDYRMLPEPNLQPIILEESYIQEVTKDILLPKDRRQQYHMLPPATLEVIVNKKILGDYLSLLRNKNVILSANLLVSYVSVLGDKWTSIDPKFFDEIITYLDEEKISIRTAKELFLLVLEDKSQNLEEYIKTKDLFMITSEEDLLPYIQKTIQDSPLEVQKYQNGNTRLIEALVGAVLKSTNSKASPTITRNIMQKLLNNHDILSY